PDNTRSGGCDQRPCRLGDPALTGLRCTGIVVSRAQGALGLLPFAVCLPPGEVTKVTAGGWRRRVARGDRSGTTRRPVPGRATRPTAGAGRCRTARIGGRPSGAGRPGTTARHHSR